MRILIAIAALALGCSKDPQESSVARAATQGVRGVTEVQVLIPEEQYALVEFRQDDLPGVAVVNSALVSFPGREAFGWHLSIIISFQDLIENGMPSQSERDIVDPFCDLLERELKSPEERPNALFLGRVTWNGTRQMMFRVNDPEVADEILQSIISGKRYPREFVFQMENDDEWLFARWYLDAGAGK